MANRHRGEVSATLGGTRFTLCLTLGALAELEDAFAADGLGALGQRLAGGAVSARDLIRILAIAARGGGHDVGEAEIAALPVTGGIDAYARAVADVFAAAFGETENASRP